MQLEIANSKINYIKTELLCQFAQNTFFNDALCGSEDSRHNRDIHLQRVCFTSETAWTALISSTSCAVCSPANPPWPTDAEEPRKKAVDILAESAFDSRMLVAAHAIGNGRCNRGRL